MKAWMAQHEWVLNCYTCRSMLSVCIHFEKFRIFVNIRALNRKNKFTNSKNIQY